MRSYILPLINVLIKFIVVQVPPLFLDVCANHFVLDSKYIYVYIYIFNLFLLHSCAFAISNTFQPNNDIAYLAFNI